MRTGRLIKAKASIQMNNSSMMSWSRMLQLDNHGQPLWWFHNMLRVSPIMWTPHQHESMLGIKMLQWVSPIASILQHHDRESDQPEFYSSATTTFVDITWCRNKLQYWNKLDASHFQSTVIASPRVLPKPGGQLVPPNIPPQCNKHAFIT